MTVIVNTIWGRRISQIVDRQISRAMPHGGHAIVDPASNKAVIALTRDSLFSLAYTGIAVAHQNWMDCQIANCLAHCKLEPAFIQPGTQYLARPVHTILDELRFNLNGVLNSDVRARVANLTISIVGWHLGATLKPFAWELVRGPVEDNRMRYFRLKLSEHRVGKLLRENPLAIFGETYGDSGDLVDGRLVDLAATRGMNHDDIEFYFRDAIRDRSEQTTTVSPDCIAIQLDPRVEDWQVRVTYYPAEELADGHPAVSPWIMTPRLICAPALMTSSMLPTSDCGRYALGGFKDGITNLKVQLRLPIGHAQSVRRFGGGALVRPAAP